MSRARTSSSQTSVSFKNFVRNKDFDLKNQTLENNASKQQNKQAMSKKKREKNNSQKYRLILLLLHRDSTLREQVSEFNVQSI